MKKLVFCFDGTCNNPEDVSDTLDDISISNILKLHIFLGGKLSPYNGENTQTPKQRSFYYSGIGTRGNWIFRALNAAFAPIYGEMDDIISEAQNDLKQQYVAGDQVYIFGFSRGAAIARMFAAHLTMPVKFLGVFDTVAATKGSLDLNPQTFPASGIVFENDILAPHIEKALHILSLDEQRLWLQPTLLNHDERVTEVWFAGSHSDIGGGYQSDGLSDVCLQFMLDNITGELSVLPVEEIDFSVLEVSESSDEITYADIVIKPEVNGTIHRQLFTYSHMLTHAVRSVRVNIKEAASDNLAVIHYSVAERFRQLSEYRPEALNNVSYQVLDVRGQLSRARYGISGLSEDLE